MRAKLPSQSLGDASIVGGLLGRCYWIIALALVGCSLNSRPIQKSDVLAPDRTTATSPDIAPGDLRPKTESAPPSAGSNALDSSGSAAPSPPPAPPDTGATKASVRSSEERKSDSKLGGPEEALGSPGKALGRARKLRERAAAAQRGKKFGEAFGLATEALEAVQQFPEDAECKSYATELLAELEVYSQNAGAQTKATAADRSKTLVEQ